MSAENKVHSIGLEDVLRLFSIASAANNEHGLSRNVRSLQTARDFDATFPPETVGYRVKLPFDAAGLVKPIYVLTDPEFSRRLMSKEEFGQLTVDCITHKTHRHLKGKFLLQRTNRSQWTQERRAANTYFSHHNVEAVSHNLAFIACAALEKVIPVGTAILDEHWLKKYVARFLITNLTGTDIDDEILERGLNSHQEFTKNSLRLLIHGTPPEPLHFVAKRQLRDFHTLVRTLTTEYQPHSIIDLVTTELNARQIEMDIFDVVSSLIAGTNTVTSYMTAILVQLSRHPDIQAQIFAEIQSGTNSELIRSFIYEVGRTMPAAPLIARKAEQAFEFEGITFEKNALIFIGLFAFGGARNIHNAEEFDPKRPGLEKMVGQNGGGAFTFGLGPKACVAQYFNWKALEILSSEIIRNYHITCTNDPQPLLGGTTLRFRPNPAFILTGREQQETIHATFSH